MAAGRARARGLAGGAGRLALALREAVLASPALVDWLRAALEPLQRAGLEGYTPSTPERRRLAALGALTAVIGGWFLGGVALAAPLAIAGPGLAAWAISSRHRRFPAAGERALPGIAVAVAG